MTKNIEKDFIEQASKVDVAAIDTRLGEVRGEMATLVKPNLTAGVDTEIYSEEYHRINGEMEELRGKRSVVTQAEIVRRETLERAREIEKVLRGMDAFWPILRLVDCNDATRRWMDSINSTKIFI